MRAGVWCALALLLAAATALRTPQGVGALRVDRRSSTSTISSSSSDQLEELKPTFRPRDSRRRHKEEIAPRDVSRSRTRQQQTMTTTVRIETNEKEMNTFDSRKSFSRTRSRPVINETNFDTTLKRDNTIQRTRRVHNRANITAYIPTNPASRGINKYEATVTEPAKLDSENNAANDQIKRRPSARSRENQTRSRARIDTRSDIGALDMDVAGTVNTITIIKPTTSRIDDIRNSRKLRYKTRFSETDTNLTGEVLKSTVDEKSSQNKESVTSQPEVISSSVSISNFTSKGIGRKLRTSTIKSMRVVKRPVSKEKFRSSEVSSEAKAKVSDEISEDDNYPESFKALIQKKNASTSASSPSESLAVKASQKVYQTFTPSPQTNNTGSETDDWRLRNTTKIEQGITEVAKIENNLLEKVPNTEAQSLENSSRGTTTVNPKVIVSLKPSSRKLFKSSRNIKVTSTEPSVRSKQVTGLKKPIRNSIYARRSAVSNISTEKELPPSAESSEIKKPVIAFKPKQVLPRTSYYSRSRNYTKKTMTTTDANIPTVNTTVADKKIESTADAPIIFTYLSRSKNPELVDVDIFEQTSEKAKEPFIIKISSTESFESAIEKKQEWKDVKTLPFDNASTTTQKYHATYKDSQANNSIENNNKYTALPPIRNIQTRKYSRKNGKLRKNEDSVTISPRSKERSLRKYSDTYSKTTESSSNGIVGEQEKPKHKFSSKYRASYLDKPFYKPTVPTITSSTAWLKFFVTDPEVSKTIEEPKWFEEEDFVGVTTTKMSGNFPTSKQNNIMTATSMKTVEGEEVELGSGMNAISFTKPRSPLTSADLRLSESFMKPSQILNVEASNHSPSVTVSIFDALADILTSTPKPKISSTTEVYKTPNIINDVDKSLNGVSSNTIVNTINSFTSQISITSTDVINTSAKIVQTTEGATQNVLNSLSVRENVTPSLNVAETVSTPVSFPTYQQSNVTPVTFSTTPMSTTSVSQRKPFAFKVLYSETEPYLDKTTAVTSTTDNTAMVYNTVSDLLLSNNKLVSSELTSMLSNNIENIMQNMDENRKSKLSVDMAKLLNTLIPKALNRRKILPDEEGIVFNTTPYSLEDIRDTENIDFSILNDTSITNSSYNKINMSVSIDTSVMQNDLYTAGVANDSEVKITTESTEFQSDDIVLSSSSDINIAQAAVASDVEASKVTTTVSTPNDSLNDTTNKSVPVPFIPNYQSSNSKSDLINDNNNFTSSASESSTLELTEIENSMDSVQDPTQLSRLQLWVLSKKARVLKMIEEIIKAHHDEIDSISLTESVKPFDNISNRLTDIMTSSISTTLTSDLNNELTSMRSSNPISSTISSFLSTPTTIVPVISTETTTVLTNNDIISSTQSETLSTGITQTTTTPSYEESNVIMKTNMDNKPVSITSFNSNFDGVETTTSDVKELNSRISENTSTESNSENIIETTTITESSKNESIEETTTSQYSFRSNVDETTSELTVTTENSLLSQNDEDIKTTVITNVLSEDMQTTRTSQINESENVTSSTSLDENSSISTTESNIENISNFSENVAPTPNSNLENNSITKNPIPKKDYVIFGILPNNTVVRKDPNDDILESLTEASPYIIYGVLPNNTVIRKFPNGTRVPRITQKIDILPISPWNLRNPYSPIHNIPAIVRPKSNPTRVSTNTVTFQDTSNNGTENQLTTNTVNNLQRTISSSTPNIKDSSSLGITYTTFKAPTEKSTASHVLSLRTTTMLPSVDEILLNSISSATLEEMAISSMTSSTHEPRILTLDIDPETKQIRTEKPDSENGNTVFKFIPIDEVTVSSQESNVLKLASTKGLKTTENNLQTMTSVTESDTQSLQDMKNDISSSTILPTAGTPFENIEQVTVEFQSPIMSDDSTTKSSLADGKLEENTDSNFLSTTDNLLITMPITSTKSNNPLPQTTITSSMYVDSTSSVTTSMPTTDTYNVQPLTSSSNVENKVYMDDSALLQQMLIEVGRNSKSLGGFDSGKVSTANSSQPNESAKLLQSLLSNQKQPTQNSVSDYNSQDQTTLRSIEEDIKQFEEDSKLLKALLIAMGRDPAELNLPNLDGIKQTFGITEPSSATTMSTQTTTQSTTTLRNTMPTETVATTIPKTTRTFPTTTLISSTKNIVTTTIASSIDDDIKQLQDDTKLLQALLQFNGNQNANNLPEVSGITSNVRLASNLLSNSFGNNPTTPINIRPVYTAKLATTTPLSSTFSTLQPRRPNAENMGISSTLLPFNERVTKSLPFSTTSRVVNQNPRSGFTTEIPSTSTFSDAEDLAFLQNLKSVLGTKNNGDDPETALANRVIALAVERSLNEIQGGKDTISTSTTIRTTTTQTTSTSKPNTPSIEEDLKQFEEDTKLLQALLKATGQDPSKLNLPVLPNVNVSPKLSTAVNGDIDLNLLSNLLVSPSPLNEPFESLTQEPVDKIFTSRNAPPTTAKSYGTKIAVKDDLKIEQDDAKLLQTLIKLQDAQETTTQRSKLAITGQSSDEALKNLIKQAQPTNLVSEATKSSLSLSTEYGNSNDALLAALLKEQGFGPTTASSLDEQLRLAALLNQVVVTPKTPRRTTTPPPPPPPPRRPILDGLAWLWQQWRETAPGPGAPRPNRGPASTSRPSATQSAATSSRVNWFGSGPFVGNAGDTPSANRIPLEPPSAADPAVPGRGQLVSAAINVSRAFSQFLGAAIQGAAQTVQSVIRAGQRAASDVYTNGSGSG